MLTVKFVAPDGEENIRECETVIADRTEHDGRPRVLVFDGLPMSDKANQSGMYVAPSEMCTDWMHSGIVYVMNRFGATVATYRL